MGSHATQRVPRKAFRFLRRFFCVRFLEVTKNKSAQIVKFEMFFNVSNFCSCESSFGVKKIRELIPLRQKHVQTRPLNKKMQRGSSLPKISSNLLFFFNEYLSSRLSVKVSTGSPCKGTLSPNISGTKKWRNLHL